MHDDLALDTRRQFLSPQEVRAGDGSIGDVGEMLLGWGLPRTRVLVVCDGALVRLGVLQPLRASLQHSGFEVAVFDSVVTEPDVATADAAVRTARELRPVAVVGLGGGSAMDVAKLAAALAGSTTDTHEILGIDMLQQQPLPLVLIPTTAGTGAEATRVAMVSQEGDKRIINDAKLVPRGVVLDPALTVSVPPHVTASTGLDALSHAIESTLSLNASTLTIRAGLDAVELLASSLLPAYEHGDDKAARRGMLFGAHLAGLSLNASSTLGHSIGYTIANRVKVPHGISVAMALPYCVAYAAGASQGRIDRIFARVGAPAEGYRSLLDWLEAFLKELDVPSSLAAVGIDRSELGEMVAECVGRYPRPNNPVALDEVKVAALYERMFTGDLSGYVDSLEAASSAR